MTAASGGVGMWVVQLAGLLGACRGMVDSVWPLEKYEEAFKILDSGHAKGKIVLNLEPN